MIDLITLGLVVVVLLENNPNRKKAATDLFTRFKRTFRGLWS